MTSTAEKVFEDALALPEDERRDLAKRLLESVPGAESDHRQAWLGVAKQRADEVERGEGELVDLDEALGSVRAALRRVRGA